MSEVKLIPKNLDKTFLNLIEPLAQFLISNKVHPHFITALGFTVSIVAAVLFSEGQFLLAGIMVILSGVSPVSNGNSREREMAKLVYLAAVNDEKQAGEWRKLGARKTVVLPIPFTPIKPTTLPGRG